VLLLLLRNPGRLVTKEEILSTVWTDAAVSDNSLTRSIATLRRLLGDDKREPRYIATVHTVGYRFLCDVQVMAELAGVVTENGLEPAVDSDRKAGALPKLDAGTVTADPFSSGLPHDSRIPGLPAQGSPVPPSLPPYPPHLSPYKWLWHSVPMAAIALIALATGAVWHPRRATPHLPATEQRVTFNSPNAPIQSPIVSPDGKYVAYADPTGLYLRHVATGETHPWGVPKDFVAYPNSWFPDGTHLLVTRSEGSYMEPSLWKLSLLGGSPRMLMAGGYEGVVSPDGSRIAYLTGSGWGRELWSMAPDGANPRKIATAKQGGSLQQPAWSPDAQRIAYVESAFAAVGSANYASVQTRDASGGDPHIVWSDARLMLALCWAADGRILFAYREDLRNELFDEEVRSIQVDQRTGKAIGAPQTVTHGQGAIGTLSVTADGKRLLLGRENTHAQSFIADFEAGRHRLKTPRLLTMDANGNFATAWAPDSKSVLLVSNRNGTWKIFRQAIDQTTAEVLVEGRSFFLPRLSADGSQVLYLSYPEPSATGVPAAVMRVPLAGGPPQLVLRALNIFNIQCAGPRSGLCIFNKEEGAASVFFAFDPERGIDREITQINKLPTFNWCLSPDGSLLAVFPDDHTIRFVSLKTGAAHDVLVKDWHVNKGDWSADGRSIYIPSFTPTGVPVVLNVNEEGKAEVVLQGAPNTGFWYLIQSPDGRHAIVEEDVPGDNNVWMVDNF
jgi:Tol biopolymer transport system component